MKVGKAKLFLTFCLFFFVFFGIAQSVTQVTVEFFYWDPSTDPRFCPHCSHWIELYEEFLSKNETITNIQSDYADKVLVEWIEYRSYDGQEKAASYNITSPNSVMINGEVRIEGAFNETSLREIIDAYLSHDVAVLSVVPFSSSICVGDILDINVTVKNLGKYVESFNVTVYYDSNVVGALFVDGLAPSIENTPVFHWSTENITEGNYTISARADTLLDEIETDNNVRYGSVVEVRASQDSTIRHDVAIISVIPSHSVVISGERVNITVTAKNIGTETESFNVSVYCGELLIDTLPVEDLSPSSEILLTFAWDTSNNTPDRYSIHAEAGPVVNEIFTGDNVYDYGEVDVTLRSSLDSFAAILALAFSFGFFETFSPCLMVLLSFVLSYTAGKTVKFREGMLQVTFFGVGFVVAAVSVGLAVGLMFFVMGTFNYILTWIVCILAIIFGLNLLGLFKMTSLETKPLVQKLSKKYAFTYGGLLLLGFLFYFLDPCIAPIFVAMLPLLTLEYMPLIILVFSLGVILPFVIVGVFVSSISKLVRGTYRHKSKIRAVSGLILIIYALYLIIFYLL